MAAEAEAAREARAKVEQQWLWLQWWLQWCALQWWSSSYSPWKVIAAEGEHKASRALKHAAEVIADSPAALQVFHNHHNCHSKHIWPTITVMIDHIFSCATSRRYHHHHRHHRHYYLHHDHIFSCATSRHFISSSSLSSPWPSPQLRYLQTLNSISAENNSTIIFPVPIDVMSQVTPWRSKSW